MFNLSDMYLRLEELNAHKALNPHPSDVELTKDIWAIKRDIDMMFMMRAGRYEIEEHIASVWGDMYFSAARFIASICIGREDYLAFRFHPMSQRDMNRKTIMEVFTLKLVIEIFVVPTREYNIPVFTYDFDTCLPIEWKCGYCGMINPMEATYCGEIHKHAVGCGHPRAKIWRGN